LESIEKISSSDKENSLSVKSWIFVQLFNQRTELSFDKNGTCL